MKVICHAVLLSLLVTQAEASFGDFPGSNQACETDEDCPLIQCLIPPCPAAVCKDGVCGIEDNPPNPECIRDSDCPQIYCFVAPCDVNVCIEGLCVLQPPPTEESDNQASPGIPCGPNICTGGEPCCNPSCGYCGDICTEEYCLSDDEIDVVSENGSVQPANDTLSCTTDADCPVIRCFVAPCDVYVCNTTVGECFVEEVGLLCGVNITCDDDVVLNTSVASDNISATDGPEIAVDKDAASNASDSDKEIPAVAESKSTREMLVLPSLAFIAASILLL